MEDNKIGKMQNRLQELLDSNQISAEQFQRFNTAIVKAHSGTKEEVHDSMDEIRKSVDSLFKGYASGVVDKDTIMKAVGNGKLVPKKVNIKRQDGTVYQAIRWVDPTSGESPRKSSKGTPGTVKEEDLEGILSSSSPRAEKLHSLVNAGIYDPAILSLLTDFSFANAKRIVTKELNIDPKNPSGGGDGGENKPNSQPAIKQIEEAQTKLNGEEGREGAGVLRSVSIDLIWDFYKSNLTRVIRGVHKFAIAYGTGGVGKTYTFEQLAEKFNMREFDDEIMPTKDQYDYVTIKGKITPTQVYAEMYRHRDKLIVFDDCDSFLALDEVQGFLKGGLDTGTNTKISNKSSRKVYNIEGDKESGEIPNSFRFTGRVIAITNLKSEDIDQAIFSRALASNLSMTVDETIEKLGQIKNKIKVYTADKTEVIEVDEETRDMAYEILKEHKDELGNAINTRVYLNALVIAHFAKEIDSSKELIKQEIEYYFESVTGAFDRQIRSKTKKNSN